MGKPPLQIGDKVLMQDHITWLRKQRGEVASVHKQGVSYEIKGENGKLLYYSRNQQQLKLAPLPKPRLSRDLLLANVHHETQLHLLPPVTKKVTPHLLHPPLHTLGS